jgi:hypothetical protein
MGQMNSHQLMRGLVPWHYEGMRDALAFVETARADAKSAGDDDFDSFLSLTLHLVERRSDPGTAACHAVRTMRAAQFVQQHREQLIAENWVRLTPEQPEVAIEVISYLVAAMAVLSFSEAYIEDDKEAFRFSFDEVTAEASIRRMRDDLGPVRQLEN